MRSSLAARRPAPDVLAEILSELRAIRGLLETRAQPSTLSRDDRARLARLLPAIGGAIGSEPFHSAEIVEHESPALRVVAAGLSAKHVGRLLRRATGRPVDEWLVERCGIEAGVTLWRIVQMPPSPRNEKVSVPHARSHALV